MGVRRTVNKWLTYGGKVGQQYNVDYQAVRQEGNLGNKQAEKSFNVK